MQDSNIPPKFTIPWANSAAAAYINAIPTASQIGVNAGYASLTDGFVPLNDTPIASGGVPPRIKDWNGILNEITAWNRWQQAGGTVPYDATFSSAIGGYPKGSILSVAATPGKFWVSIVDNNTTDPDTGGAGWQPLVENLFSTVVAKNTAYTLLPSDLGTYFSISATTTITLPLPSGITAGYPVGIANNGAAVVTVNTNSANVYLPTGVTNTTFTMQPGDFVMFEYDGASWRVLGASRAQLGAATLAGSSSQVFSVANATAAANAVALGQMLGNPAQSWKNVTSSRTSGTVYTNSEISPIMIAITNNSGTGSAVTMSLSVGGVLISAIDNNSQSSGQYVAYPATVIVPPGVSYSCTSSSTFANWSELR